MAKNETAQSLRGMIAHVKTRMTVCANETNVTCTHKFMRRILKALTEYKDYESELTEPKE